MKLYEIDKRILDCIDTETGKILDGERLAALRLDRAEVIRNLALEVKNRRADALALKNEEAAFAERRRAAEKSADALENFLAACLNGETASGADFIIKWRKSAAIIVQDESLVPDEYKVHKVSIDKAKAMADAKSGKPIPGLAIEERNNMTVK